MSLRFFTDSILSAVREYSLPELFNPTINQCIFEDRNGLTVSKWMKIQKQLYCEHNVRSEPRKLIRGFVNIVVSEERRMITDVMDAIGPENYQALAYMEYAGNNGSISVWAFFTPGRVRADARGSTFFSYDDTYRELPRWGTDEWKVELKTAATAITTRLSNIEAAHGGKVMSVDTPLGITNFVRVLNSHTSNQRYIRSAGGGNGYTPLEVVEGIRANTIQLTISQNNQSPVVTAAERITRTNKRALYQVMGYNASPTELLSWPIVNKGEIKPVLYGVELECATDYNVRQLIDATDEPFMIAKSDSSVSGRGALRVELVTVPMSFRAHKREWAKWFSKLDYDKFDTTKNTSNGMHVHIGRDHFADENHVKRLTWFVNNPANRDFIFALSERTQQSLDGYSPLARFGSSTSKVRNYNQVTNIVGSMRGAINLASNKPTVEVRLFRGIVSYAAILKNLECVDAFFHFTAEANFNQLNLKGFLNWLEETPPNKYAIFKKFIFKLPNFQELVSSSDIYEIIQNTTDPHQIIRIIEKKNFKVTNAHITVLNRQHKKRTFILDKETGTIRLKLSDRSPLFHLDRKLQQDQLRGLQQ